MLQELARRVKDLCENQVDNLTAFSTLTDPSLHALIKQEIDTFTDTELSQVFSKVVEEATASTTSSNTALKNEILNMLDPALGFISTLASASSRYLDRTPLPP